MSQNTNILQTPIEYLKGVGPSRAELLKKELGIFSFGDLLQLFPFRYVDRSRFYKINEIQSTEIEFQIVGSITRLEEIKGKGRSKRLVARFEDETGSTELVWFQGAKWIRSNLKTHQKYVLFGKPNWYGGKHSFPHPELELLADFEKSPLKGLQPVYPSTEKLTKNNLSSGGLRKLILNLLPQVKGNIQEFHTSALLAQHHLPKLEISYFETHFPRDQKHLQQARRRLKFDELFFLQMEMIRQKRVHKQNYKGFAFEKVGEHFNAFYEKVLPFELTGAQKRVLKEIRRDMMHGEHMNRLLQGDVGSGKTMVALMSMLMAIDNGFQACLMAPTEILANQHYNGIRELVEPLGIKVELLTGSTKSAKRKLIHQDLESGDLPILIGTHALIEEKVKFKNLGLAVVDEQHRFGVAQRAKLWKKNSLPPHVLVMTATPIPRTLAMTAYGNLDISVIDELPPGRKPIATIHRYDSNRLQVFGFIKEEIAKGRQVYIVYPLIQESEALDYKDLMDGYESITRAFPRPDYQVSIVHGKMKSEDKDFEMQRFAEGKTQIMVATTVIEVGVNVPNASVMLIESAERFGLSQLHQLRGRVGRGAEKSYCILLTSFKLSKEAKKRMQTMVETNDGFRISEVDLELRGPGDMMGTRQSGLLNLRIANLLQDSSILNEARQALLDILEADPQMNSPQYNQLRLEFAKRMKGKTGWGRIS